MSEEINIYVGFSTCIGHKAITTGVVLTRKLKRINNCSKLKLEYMFIFSLLCMIYIT